MKYLMSKKLGVLLVSILGCALLSACTTSNVPYRTYYLDSSCHYYYTDSTGRVVEARDMGISLVGLPLQRDAMGRWYYQDSYGNRIYRSARCG